jgi:hypothetical protein
MNIVEAFELVVDSINVSQDIVGRNINVGYKYGHLLEVNNRLKVETMNASNKYPLVVLRLDTPERVANGFRVFENLNVLILDFTDKKYNAEQRFDNVFVPRLYPIYSAMLEAFNNVGLFTWEKPISGDNQFPPHVKHDRYYWGSLAPYQNVKQIFDDPLDAIEISSLSLKLRTTC